MPGVSVATATRSGPVAPTRAPASTFFVAGLTERGRTDAAVLVRSMADYEAEFGARVAYGSTWDAVKSYFEEGGTRAVIARTVGAAATVGTRTLLDRAAVTPLATLRIDAKGAGAWSSGVTVAVADGAIANTFKVTIAAVADGAIAEVYDNLASPAAAATAINNRSKWVTAADLGSATVAPGNNPAVLAATALSAGTDDRASVTAASYVAALNALATPGFGAGAVAIPGQTSALVGAGLIAHAKTNQRIALLAGAATATSGDLIGAAAPLRNADGAYAGLFYPWVQVPDGAGGVRAISPEGFVAGARARAQLAEGPWRAPGGEISEARYVVGVVTPINRATGDSLDAANVSAIRTIANTVRLYGWRSLSSDDQNYALLTGRDTLNHLVVEGEKRLEQYVFRTIDGRGHLFGELAAEIIGLVEPIRVLGGVYEAIDENGETIDPGYSVDVGPSVNTTATLLANEAHVALVVRISPTGALIRLLITKAGLTASV